MHTKSSNTHEPNAFGALAMNSDLGDNGKKVKEAKGKEAQSI